MSKGLQFLIYNTPREDIRVNVVMRNETLWQQITDIFAEYSFDYE